jgi:membrane-associated protein
VAGYLAGESYRALESSLGLAANILLGLAFALVLALWLRAVLRRRRGSASAAASQETAAPEGHPVPDVH